MNPLSLIAALQIAVSLLIAAQNGTVAQKQTAITYAAQIIQLAQQSQQTPSSTTSSSPQPADSGINLGNSVNTTSTPAPQPEPVLPPPAPVTQQLTQVHPDVLDTKFSYTSEAINDHTLFTFRNPNGLSVSVTMNGETKDTITKNVEFFNLSSKPYPYSVRIQKGNRYATFEGVLVIN